MLTKPNRERFLNNEIETFSNLNFRTILRTLGKEEKVMTVLNATEARSKLYSLIDETANTHKPII
ncbi:MAG: type II toxin-antitoxin system Phd/YefM family antitoxin, partial [Chlorobiales bacterium]|nr:type II toxin-antitoxin system Phd/YefM family antitoxin [Chlorobiales bacterium]